MVQNKQTKKSLDVSESSHCLSSIFKGGFASVDQRALGGLPKCCLAQRQLGILNTIRPEGRPIREQPHVCTMQDLICKAMSSYLQLFTTRPPLTKSKESTSDIPVNVKHLLKWQDELLPHTAPSHIVQYKLSSSCWLPSIAV